MTLGFPDDDPNGLPGSKFGRTNEERARGLLFLIVVIVGLLLFLAFYRA
jgi:hypothetical protein